MKMPIQDRRYYIQKHNYEMEQKAQEENHGGGNNIPNLPFNG